MFRAFDEWFLVRGASVEARLYGLRGIERAQVVLPSPGVDLRPPQGPSLRRLAFKRCVVPRLRRLEQAEIRRVALRLLEEDGP